MIFLLIMMLRERYQPKCVALLILDDRPRLFVFAERSHLSPRGLSTPQCNDLQGLHFAFGVSLPASHPPAIAFLLSK